MKTRRQTKRFYCDKCGAVYLHDDAHAHVQHLCEERPAVLRQRWLEQGKVYEPRTGK